MNLFKRPTTGRKEWESSDNTRRNDAITKIQGIVDTGGTPKSEDFPSVWNKISPHFRKAQHDLCGYCAEKTKGGGLDHFRPKAEVKRKLLKAGKHDPETDGSSGRSFDTRYKHPGYHNLAYEWDNLVLSCGICNSKWKDTYFPVTRGSDDEYLGPPAADEVPRMRSPFAESDPLSDFEINPERLVSGQTPGAYWTIEVCGLWRESLIRNRKEKYAAARRALKDYLRIDAPTAEKEDARKDLASWGEWSKPLACVVRAAAAALGLVWDEHFASLSSPVV